MNLLSSKPFLAPSIRGRSISQVAHIGAGFLGAGWGVEDAGRCR